jgi:hypothetical protein
MNKKHLKIIAKDKLKIHLILMVIIKYYLIKYLKIIQMVHYGEIHIN